MQGIDYVGEVAKVDDYTFVISYTGIYPGYLTQLGGEQLAIWPAHYCDAQQGFTAWDCARTPLSDGPFTLQEWVVGDHMIFVRTPNYYQAGKPTIDQVIVRIVPDATVRKTMLLKGDADVDVWTTEPVAFDLKDKPNVQLSVSPFPRWVLRLFFNLAAKGSVDAAASPHPILSDVRVRQAIRMAIDVEVDADGDGIADSFGTRKGILRGDFGFSFRTRELILKEIGLWLPNTIYLMAATMLVAIVIALPIGILLIIGAAAIILSNLLANVLYAYLDPRIRYKRSCSRRSRRSGPVGTF